MTATNWLLYQLTNSPVQLGLNGVFRAIPAITLGLISGTFADRYDRRWLMLWTQLILGAEAWRSAFWIRRAISKPGKFFCLPLSAHPWARSTARRARPLFPSLVPRSVLPNAVALNSLL